MALTRAVKAVKIVILILAVSRIANMQRRQRSQLPNLTGVQVEIGTDAVNVTVSFTARRRPDFQWYIDDWALPASENVYTLQEKKSGSSVKIQLPGVVDNGKRVTFCLHHSIGHSCMTLRPLTHGSNGGIEEPLDFPWPSLVPAVKARYEMGQQAHILAPELATHHPYSYSATFIGRPTPSPSRFSITVSSSRDTASGRYNDVVKITRVTNGRPGWKIELATDYLSWEGVVLVNTTFQPLSGMVQSYTSVRSVSVYLRQHNSPFPRNFTTTVPVQKPAACREATACRVTCPYVSNGAVRAELTHRREIPETGGPEEDQRIYSTVNTWKWGKFYREAIFELPAVPGARDARAGNYVCIVSSSTHGASSYISVTMETEN